MLEGFAETNGAQPAHLLASSSCGTGNLEPRSRMSDPLCGAAFGRAGSGLLQGLVRGGHPDGPGGAGIQLDFVRESLQQVCHGIAVIRGQGCQV